MSVLAVVCEARAGELRSATFELLSRARTIAVQTGDEVVAVAVGEDVAACDDLSGAAHRVVAVTGDTLAPYASDPWVAALAGLFGPGGEVRARLVLFGESLRTRELMPRLAVRLEAGTVANAVSLEAVGDRLEISRPVYGGKAYATFACGAGERPCLAAFRPHSFDAGSPADLATKGADVKVAAGLNRVQVLERVASATRRVDLTEAQVVVAGGRGMKGPANFPLLERLAQVLEGAVGYSRAVVDAGQAEHADQVGKSGKTVSPTLYLAFGISGAIHHIMGMDTAKVVVAVNTDPGAPIFANADYGVVGDALQVVPALIRELGGGN